MRSDSVAKLPRKEGKGRRGFALALQCDAGLAIQVRKEVP